MTIGALDATAAYGRSIKTLGEGNAVASMPGDASGSFGSMIQSVVNEAATSLRTAEAESAKQVAGKGDIIDVVTAIGAAEAALDTVVAVRDRVVSAYSEIMRMQI